MKAGISIYLIVFGIIAAIIVIAALSTFVFNKPLVNANVSVAGLPNYGPAPNIQGISSWINSAPINISSLRGKVVLVDFWTYSCINCIRSIPHLEAWYNEYSSHGLVIIGVHTPEFQFEHNYSNVYAAVQKFGIKYPVALDNNYATWDAYGNQYWPADYIIDKNGNIRDEVFGEGNYNQTENVIRALLENANYSLPSNMTNVPLGVNFSQINSPEIYLGYSKAREPLGNSQGFVQNQIVNYTFQNITQPNVVYLSGDWLDASDSLIAVSNSKLFLVYDAPKVNIVAAPNETNSATIYLKVDGKNVTQQYLGADARQAGNLTLVKVNTSRLYNIVSNQAPGLHELEIDANPGFRIYTFTFG